MDKYSFQVGLSLGLAGIPLPLAGMPDMMDIIGDSTGLKFAFNQSSLQLDITDTGKAGNTFALVGDVLTLTHPRQSDDMYCPECGELWADCMCEGKDYSTCPYCGGDRYYVDYDGEEMTEHCLDCNCGKEVYDSCPHCGAQLFGEDHCSECGWNMNSFYGHCTYCGGDWYWFDEAEGMDGCLDCHFEDHEGGDGDGGYGECPYCGHEMFYDSNEAEGDYLTCGRCGYRPDRNYIECPKCGGEWFEEESGFCLDCDREHEE